MKIFGVTKMKKLITIITIIIITLISCVEKCEHGVPKDKDCMECIYNFMKKIFTEEKNDYTN